MSHFSHYQAPDVTPDEPGHGEDFAYALNEAIRARGLTLERIRARLTQAGTPVSIATLSYWQTGRSLPTRSSSLRVVAELEQVLGLEPGSLAKLASHERRRRQMFLSDWEGLVPSPEVASHITGDLGMTLTSEDLTRVTVHDTIIIADDRTESNLLTRMVVRAERQGVDRWPVVLLQDATMGTVPDIEALSGCSTGRTVAARDHNLLVAEMLLPHPLDRGEVWMVEFIVNYAETDEVSSRLTRSFTSPVREIVLEAQFHPDAVPDRVEWYTRPQLNAGDDIHGTVGVYDARSQRVLHDVPPGAYGLRWDWD